MPVDNAGDERHHFNASVSHESLRDTLSTEGPWGRELALLVQHAIVQHRRSESIAPTDVHLTAQLRAIAAHASDVGLPIPKIGNRLGIANSGFDQLDLYFHPEDLGGAGQSLQSHRLVLGIEQPIELSATSIHLPRQRDLGNLAPAHRLSELPREHPLCGPRIGLIEKSFRFQKFVQRGTMMGIDVTLVVGSCRRQDVRMKAEFTAIIELNPLQKADFGTYRQPSCASATRGVSFLL